MNNNQQNSNAVEACYYRVERATWLSPQLLQIILLPARQQRLSYQAGQYLEIVLPEGSAKPFSIANMPQADHRLELHIRHVPGRTQTAEVIALLTQAQEFLIRGPYGQCVYRSEPDYPVIFVAGGTGFAPAKAMLEQAFQQTPARPLYLYWGARTPADFYLLALPQQWAKQHPNFHFIPVLSGAAVANWPGRSGSIREIVAADHPNLTHCLVYASGPPEFVYAVRDTLTQTAQLPASQIFSDWFDLMLKQS